MDNATKLYFDLDEIEKLITVYEKGIYKRTMRETFVNETSSRSHLVFAVIIEMSRIDEQVPFRIGKLTWIDLAGSESLAEIGVDRSRFFEGMHINDSLKCLGMVIKQVSCNVAVSYNLHVLTKLM